MILDFWQGKSLVNEAMRGQVRLVQLKALGCIDTFAKHTFRSFLESRASTLPS